MSRMEVMAMTDPHLAAFNAAAEQGDMEGAKAALVAMYEACEHKNGYCLKELFCPECPVYVPTQSAKYMQNGGDD